MSIRLHVHIQVPKEAPREFDLEFDQPKIIIGRKAGSDVMIPLSTVSRQHAIIFSSEGQWFIKDLNSTHGTYCNDVVIGGGSERQLNDGDTISIVHATISVHFLNTSDAADTASRESTSFVAREAVKNALNEDAQEASLRVENGSSAGELFSIPQKFSEALLGRGSACEFRIQDSSISREHAQLSREWDDVWIEDLKSKNGTYVNGVRLEQKQILADGDTLRLGKIELVFSNQSERLMRAIEDEPKPVVAKPEVQKKVLESPIKPSIEEKSISPKANNIDRLAATKESILDSESHKLSMVEYVTIGLAMVVFIGLIIGLIIALA